MVLLLSGTDVDKVISTLTPDDLVSLMAQVFFHLSSPTSSSSSSSSPPSEIILPHRLSVPTTNHTALFMPSRITPFGTAMKVVSVPKASAPEDIKARGLPASTLVLDEETGEVGAMVNAGKLTALRNASGSVLSARLLIPEGSPPRTLTTIGAGTQISAHINLFLQAYPSIKSCNIINRTLNSRLTTLLDSLRSAYPGIDFRGLKLPKGAGAGVGGDGRGEEEEGRETFRRAIWDADVIVTATSSREALFPSEYVSPGTHLCLIGSYTPEMHEVDTALIKRAGIVVVDSIEACKKEAGELISSNIPSTSLYELGTLIQPTANQVPSPSPSPSSSSSFAWSPSHTPISEIHSSGDITIFKSVGVSLQDVAIASLVVQRAQEKGLGTSVVL